MRYVVVCDVWDEPTVIAEAWQRFDRSADRIVVLSPRRGVIENNDILRVPIRFKLEDAGLPNWRRKHWVRKTITLATGLRSAKFFSGIEDLFLNIEAGDPDVIYLYKLRDFGRWLEAKCTQRFPGRTVITDSSGCSSYENVAGWRSYDTTALVSIILPVCNGERYLRLSIESCLVQTHQNIELIIVDDASSDSTPAVIKEYATADRRIKTIRNEINLGVPEALNVGFKLSVGAFLTWTSDDNLYARTAIEYMVQQLCTFTEIGLVYCGSHHIDETGNRIGLQIPLPPLALVRENTVNACFLYRREVMDAVGPYRSAYRYIEDWDFFVRACLKFSAKSYIEPCYFYRKHGNSLTSAHSDKWKALSKKLYREHFGAGDSRIVVPSLRQLVPNGVTSTLSHSDASKARDVV